MNMFYEAILTVVLMFNEPEIPFSSIEVPQKTLKVCTQQAEEIKVKVAKDLDKAGVKYKTFCTKIGTSL